ncbi:MAG: hypothetical protein ACLT1X_10815 [Christensenellales bacterium]|jgi:hypothetical protein
MSRKQQKRRSENNDPTKALVLATALVNLVAAVVKLISELLNR